MSAGLWYLPSGSTASAFTHLEGSRSGASFDADALHTVDPEDGRPLLARYDLDAAAQTLTREALASRRSGGLWRWHELLPVRDWRFARSLGEGSTPLLPVPVLGRRYGVDRLALKAESVNPTGSFKARGMAVAVARAVELGAQRLIAPSAGNAGGALAAYAAAAGVPATVIMPADSPRVNQIEVLVTGADLLLLDGLINDCGRLARFIGERIAAFDVSTFKEPYRVEGKKTMGLELAEDCGWSLPDAVIYPTGGGTGLVGMWKAFDELEAVGLIGPQRPRMFSVQVDGCAPIVRAFAEGADVAEPWADAHTAAAGLRVPATIGDALVLDVVRASGGAALAVGEDDIHAVQRLVGADVGSFLSLESCAAVAAVPALRESGLIAASDAVVVFDTGAGFKNEADTLAPLAPVLPDDQEVWETVVGRLAGAAGAR